MATHSSILAGKNPRDRGAWQATVHEAPKSQSQLSDPAHILHSNTELRQRG